MDIGETIQTDQYKTKKYPGRKLLVEKIQQDIEPNIVHVSGRFLLKNGTTTTTTTVTVKL
jgi:hypothetical protein